MYRNSIPAAATLAFVCTTCLSGTAAGGEVDRARLEKACAELLNYEWGKPRESFNVIDDAIAASRDDADVRADLEGRLVSVIENGTTVAGRQLACRKLSRAGSAASVAALGKLLGDDRLSHMACYALERIPGDEALAELRRALPGLAGELKAGVVNSLGARRDERAAPSLVLALADADEAISAAAAYALGRIGTREAARALVDLRARAPDDIRAALTDACLDAAARLLEAGARDEAGRIYEKFDAETEPAHVRIAAFQGLVAARPDEAMPRLARALTGKDGRAQAIVAARIVKSAPGEDATRAFARALATLEPEGQVAMLDALGERADPAAKPEVLGLVDAPDGKVRLAALKALAAVGGAGEIAVLARVAAAGVGAEGNPSAEGEVAAASLASLRGDDVNGALMAALDGADAGARRVLIGALASRKVKDAVPVMLRDAGSADEDMRLTALEALGELADHTHAAELVALLKSADGRRERKAAEKALASACARAGEECADDLAAGLAGADVDTRCAIIRVLGRAGGKKALAVVHGEIAAGLAEVTDAAVRALADWPDVSALDTLLEVARSAGSETHRVLAFRGYVRIVREEGRADDAAVKLLGKAAAAATRPEEMLLVAGALGDIRRTSALRLVAKLLQEHLALAEVNRKFVEGACASAARIASKTKARSGSDKELVRSAMKLVIENAKSSKVVSDAKKALGKAGGK